MMKEDLLYLGFVLVLLLLLIIVLTVSVLKSLKKNKIIIEFDAKRARSQVEEATIALLNSAIGGEICSNKAYRQYKLALKDGQYLFKPRVKRQLDDYACVFYELLVLYPLRNELLNVKVNVKAKEIVGIHREQPINTYYDYQISVSKFARKELDNIDSLFKGEDIICE
jgi:hypothetical protein